MRKSLNCALPNSPVPQVDDILARYYGAAATKRSGGNSGSSQPHARSTRPASAAATTTEAAAAGANGVGSRLWGPAPTVPVRVGSSGGGTAHVPSSGGGGSRGACPDNEMAWGGAGVGGSHPTSLLRRATGDTLPRAMPTRPKKFDWCVQCHDNTMSPSPDVHVHN